MANGNIILHMDFINTPYTEISKSAPMTSAKEESKRKHRRSFRTTKTADKVAEFLEDRYGIINYFSSLYEEEFTDLVKDRLSDLSEEAASGKRHSSNLSSLLKPVAKQIEKKFREFLDNEEMNGQSGVPTLAAIHGIRHGRGRATKQGIPRPSFVDTGIYRASFRARFDSK